jgi:hypothetical protein
MNKPLIPERLTWTLLPDGSSYELWHTPQVKNARFHLYYYVGGTEVAKHPHDDELTARKDFERRIEEKLI